MAFYVYIKHIDEYCLQNSYPIMVFFGKAICVRES